MIGKNNLKNIPILLLILFIGITIGERKPINQQQKLCAIDITRNNVINRISEFWDETSHAEWQYLAKKKNGIDGEIIIEFRKLCEQIDNITAPIIPETVLNSLWSWPIIEEELNNLNRLYSTFRKLQIRPDPDVYAKSWEDFAQNVINDGGGADKHSVFKSLEIIQDLVYDNVEGHKSIYDNIEQTTHDQMCELSQSTNQLIFNMYTLIQMTQLKAYTMIQFSWMILKVYNKGNFSMESNLMRQSYLERLQQQAVVVRSVLQNAKNELWKCDPKSHVEGQTYTQLTRFLQGFIINEVDMNSDNTCRENCAAYQYSKQYNCFQNLFCSKQPSCRGNIVGCTFVDSDMWICQAPRWSPRRYDWIEYENGKVLGEKKACTRGVTKVDSWWRWLFWHCSYCFCFCDDSKDPLTNRYFNLRAVTSDIENNKVVTGIRFIKDRGVIHLQIQEGEILKYGEINETSVEWKPIDSYNPNSAVVGVDYHMLTWEHRAIDLDDLILPKDHILTGIRFRKIGGHINLEIRGSQLNITNGKLVNSKEKSFWLGNDNTDGAYSNPRTKVNLYKPDVPTKRTSGQSEPDSKNDQYIEFTSSDVNADAAQTAVPFIDTQIVAPQPPIALCGAGIYHKGARYSGGFIAPKVFTYDYSEQIMNFFPEINEATN